MGEEYKKFEVENKLPVERTKLNSFVQYWSTPFPNQAKVIKEVKNFWNQEISFKGGIHLEPGAEEKMQQANNKTNDTGDGPTFSL